MGNELKNLSHKELIELYLKNKEFINYLNKEHENTKKTRDNK